VSVLPDQINLPFSALTMLVGQQKYGIRPLKKIGYGLLMVTISLELCRHYSTSCHYYLRQP